MRRFTTRIVLASAITVIWLSSLQAQNQTPLKNVKPGASVSGRVTFKSKGAFGVVVRLQKPDGSGPLDAPPRSTTDNEGNYKITKVAPGDYMVIVSAPAYIANNPEGNGRRIIIGEEETLENINFTLVKGGVITGKITDADTRPVIQTSVRVYRVVDQSNRGQNNAAQPAPTPIIYPSGTQMTDDRGIYRFFGLAPGKYSVAVGRDNEGYSAPSRIAYKEVFYPDSADRAKASIIEVSEGSEAKDIDIALGRPMEMFSVSGRVVDGENGNGLPNIRLSVQQLVGDRGTFMNSSAITNAQGEFRADSLVPGKYLAYPYQEPNAELRPENSAFEIIDTDVTGLTIRMVRGASISGNVVLETDDKRALERLLKLYVQAFIQNQTGGGNPSGSSSRGTISPDGTFRVGGLGPGKVFIQLVPSADRDQLKGFSINSISRDGVLVAPRNFELKETEQVTGVRVSVAYGTARLRGQVNIENGTLVPGQRIFLQIIKLNGQQPSMVPLPTVDDRGRFIADNLAPGSYELRVSINGVRKPPLKQTVVVENDVTTDVTINFDISDKPNP